ncbi:MAG: 3-phosphoshikimate 1-carboxyvinyltransferase [Bacillota bacterium]
MELLVKGFRRLRGEIEVPGDKSISHRSAMLGALAEGQTRISGFLKGEDCLSTVRCLEECGAEFKWLPGGDLQVEGRGLHGLREPSQVLDCGNSGTTIRLLLGILAGLEGMAALTGDASLRSRPMDRVVGPLRQMGVEISGRQGGRLAPLVLKGGQVKPISYRSPVASAQVKSAVLLAGLQAEGVTSVTEPVPSRDHTERMLQAFGAKVAKEGLTVSVEGRPRLTGQALRVPGDISSAAFFLVAGSVIPGSEVLIKGVGINPTRTGILEVLAAMGADVKTENERLEAGEPVADLLVRHRPLKGTEIKGEIIPRLIDEIPVLAVAAALAEGVTVIRNAAELRVKESDRIAVMTRELSKMGVQVEELSDGMVIQGGRPLAGAQCFAQGDHRIAMAIAVAGLAASGETRIEGAESIAVSFPGFHDCLEGLRR